MRKIFVITAMVLLSFCSASADCFKDQSFDVIDARRGVQQKILGSANIQQVRKDLFKLDLALKEDLIGKVGQSTFRFATGTYEVEILGVNHDAITIATMKNVGTGDLAVYGSVDLYCDQGSIFSFGGYESIIEFVRR